MSWIDSSSSKSDPFLFGLGLYAQFVFHFFTRWNWEARVASKELGNGGPWVTSEIYFASQTFILAFSGDIHFRGLCSTHPVDVTTSTTSPKDNSTEENSEIEIIYNSENVSFLSYRPSWQISVTNLIIRWMWNSNYHHQVLWRNPVGAFQFQR